MHVRGSNKPFSCAAIPGYRRIGHRRRNFNTLTSAILIEKKAGFPNILSVTYFSYKRKSNLIT